MVMHLFERRSVMMSKRSAVAGVVAGMAVALAGCGSSTGVDAPSATFSADVTGAVTASVRGPATSSTGAMPAPQIAGEFTAPNGMTFAVIAMAGEDGEHTITLSRAGASLATGTFALKPELLRGGTLSTAGYLGVYTRRRSDGLQFYLADSGRVSITSVATRVTGTFELFANAYFLIPPLQRGATGPVVVTPISRGTAPIHITGSFDAVRRSNR
jgi:hypothetical protein